MGTVDKLIYDTLARRGSVVLPGVGTLEVKRRGAKKISETRIIPPQNVVTFTSDEVEGVPTVVSLARADGTAAQKAEELYGSWLEGARRADGGIAIDGAGEMAEGRFVVAEGLHIALNPTNEDEIVTMETERRSTPLWAWVIIGILAAQLLFGILWCWKTGVFACEDRRPPVENVIMATPEPPVADEAVVVAETAPVAKPAGPVFHIIAGAFAIESNADDFIARLKWEHPELTLEKLVNPESGYYMVSIFQSPDQRQAYNKMNLYWDIDLFLWIYRQR